MSRRYSTVDTKTPGTSAIVLVAFAGTAGTPAAIKAGNVRNVPPPATAFSDPAPNAAATIRTVSAPVTLPLYHHRSHSTSTAARYFSRVDRRSLLPLDAGRERIDSRY